jgi:multiple sugar transport system ATP-binding protein
MASVKIESLYKTFGGVQAVRGVDLDIPDGEFTVLVGPSGCGKSTLLRTVAGLETADKGNMVIGGERVNDLRPRDRDVAMVFQDYALYPHMTVAGNISLSLRARSMPQPEIEARVKKAADMLAISPLLERYPRQLSGGQRQRVAIGRAIVRNPRVFLFDEPLSNLDAQLRDEMRGEIKRLHQEIGTTMIYVTHDQIEAMTLADRIVLMRDGLIEQQGSPLDLFERPRTQFVAGFLGSPKMNFVPVGLQETGETAVLDLGDGVIFPIPRKASRRPPPGSMKLLLGMRPEHVHRATTNAPISDGHVRKSVVIELVQPTGSRTYITFSLNKHPVVAEIAAHDARHPGESIDLDFDLNRAVLIDSMTGVVLA